MVVLNAASGEMDSNQEGCSCYHHCSATEMTLHLEITFISKISLKVQFQLSFCKIAQALMPDNS